MDGAVEAPSLADRQRALAWVLCLGAAVVSQEARRATRALRPTGKTVAWASCHMGTHCLRPPKKAQPRACRAPRLTGRALAWATWLLDSTPLAGPLWAKSMRDSGIPQVLAFPRPCSLYRKVCLSLQVQHTTQCTRGSHRKLDACLQGPTPAHTIALHLKGLKQRQQKHRMVRALGCRTRSCASCTIRGIVKSQ